jgi:simple sugar transport system permease protein
VNDLNAAAPAPARAQVPAATLAMPARARLRVDARLLPLAVTLALFVLMFGAGSVLFDGFFSLQVFLNLFVDNAFLVITAIGMTFVILSGGIDLSVGSMIALTTMLSASLLDRHGVNPAAVIALALLLGASFGFLQGLVIETFKIQPFIVTLAGMFLARGLCYLISIDSIAITNPFYGRTVYAIGGSEQSALLMGLPVARTKVLIYTLSGFCSALAGIAFTFYMLSGYGLHAMGMEMDAIAAVVVGGTLLTGGSGYVVGTLFGVLIFGTIQTLIMFQGSLSSWWTKIVIGLLTLVFCLFQKAFERGSARRAASR